MRLPSDQQQRRELRLRIARLRRRIDRDIRQVDKGGRELLRWQTYVRRYPGYSMLVAIGAGLLVSAGLRGGRLPRWFGMNIARRAGGRIGDLVWQEFRQFWAAQASPGQGAETTEADHV
jgi:hypothetical protein